MPITDDGVRYSQSDLDGPYEVLFDLIETGAEFVVVNYLDQFGTLVRQEIIFW